MKTENKTFAQRFAEFEKKEHLFERTYKGLPYWQMLRFVTYYEAIGDPVTKGDAVRKRNQGNKFIYFTRALLLALKSGWNFHHLQECDVVCFTHKMKKQEKSNFFDTWKMPANIRTLYLREFSEPEYVTWKEEHNFVGPYVKSRLRLLVNKLLGNSERDEKEFLFLQQLEDKLKGEFGASLSAERMEQEIQHWRPLALESEKYAIKFFDKVKCKAIVVVCYYQNQLYSFYKVAKQRGIKIIEFQHGMVKDHHCYWFEDQRGLNNYVPDYMLTFGELHANWMKLLDSTKVVPVGFPLNDIQLKLVKDVKMNDDVIIIYPEILPGFEEELNTFANIATKKGYKVFVKLHPMHTSRPETFYPLFSSNPNISLITDLSKTSRYWLKYGKYHVFGRSTVALEAVCFDHCRIYIADFVQHEQLEPLIDEGIAESFKTAEQLMERIESQKSTEKGHREKFSHMLWQNDAVHNIQRFFEGLQERNWQ